MRPLPLGQLDDRTARRLTLRRSVLVRCAGILACLALTGQAPAGPTFERNYPLEPDQGVFAYSRISPDGRYLAYAAEKLNSLPPGNMGVRGAPQIAQTVKVVDLTTKQILFNEVGIDAYWSPDSERIIFSSYAAGSVSIWHRPDNSITRNVVPIALGDYFSWAERDGRQLIATITSNYYYLNGDKAVLPAGRVTSCPNIGVGDRPLISKDGRRISTFVRGTVVVRSLSDCKDIIDTGLQGAKADFSFDGRYLAAAIACCSLRTSSATSPSTTPNRTAMASRSRWSTCKSAPCAPSPPACRARASFPAGPAMAGYPSVTTAPTIAAS